MTVKYDFPQFLFFSFQGNNTIIMLFARQLFEMVAIAGHVVVTCYCLVIMLLFVSDSNKSYRARKCNKTCHLNNWFGNCATSFINYNCIIKLQINCFCGCCGFFELKEFNYFCLMNYFLLKIEFISFNLQLNNIYQTHFPK